MGQGEETEGGEVRVDIVGGKWLCKSTYDERRIPKDAGFEWDRIAKRWWTDNPKKAKSLESCCSPKAVEAIREEMEKKNEALAASRATTSDEKVPAPDGCEYLPFQLAAIAYGRTRKHVLLADEMGLGKTIEAIGILNCDQEWKTCLVVCPASLRINWRRELEKWLVGNCDYHDIEIVSYGMAHKVDRTEWDVVICDESHYIKNSKARRTKAVLGLKAGRWLFLTGTPVLNRPIELWPIVHFAGLFRSWRYYAERYCAACQGRYGWDVSGASHTDELADELREKLMVRRIKKDVLSELPEKRWQTISLNVDGAKQAIDAEKTEWQKFVNLKREYGQKKSSGEALAGILGQIRAQFAEISKLRHKNALRKVENGACDHIQNVVENGEPVVIFTHHVDVAERLTEKIPGAKTITGKLSLIDRQTIVDDFQAGKLSVLIGTIGAMGTGLTLTAASNVIFLELEWTPALLTQAEDRCHRIGQKNAVNVQYLVFENSIDAMLAEKLISKTKVIDEIMGDVINEDVKKT